MNECKTCGGVGEITITRGQTPETYEEINIPCPDCGAIEEEGK